LSLLHTAKIESACCRARPYFCFLVRKTGPTEHVQPKLRFRFAEDQGFLVWTQCGYLFALP
jgi:hypothetical protein